MSWPCRFLEQPALYPPEHAYFAGRIRVSELKVGDMCYVHVDGRPASAPQLRAHDFHLSDFYWAHNSQRPPLVVWLPGPTYFLIDGKCYSDKCQACGHRRYQCKCAQPRVKGYYDGWRVTGAPPAITVSPSINIENSYHGYLQNGVIGPDVENRKFDAAGLRIGRV